MIPLGIDTEMELLFEYITWLFVCEALALAVLLAYFIAAGKI
jgi:hypothetical protein